MDIYQPKGSMCANCVHKNSNCSHLDFSGMAVIEQINVDDASLKIVRCSEFKREKHDNHC